MDTGANINILADTPSHVNFPFEKSNMKATVADGSVVAAPNVLRLRDIKIPENESLFYQITGAKQSLFSNPDHVKKGYEFFLSGSRASLMWTPDNEEIIIPLVKDAGEQAAMWKIILTTDGDGRSSYESMTSTGDFQPYTRSIELPVLDSLSPPSTTSVYSAQSNVKHPNNVDWFSSSSTVSLTQPTFVYSAVVEGIDTSDSVADGTIPYEAVYSEGTDSSRRFSAVANRALGAPNPLDSNRYPLLHGKNLIASRGFPSHEAAVLTKKNSVGYGSLPKSADSIAERLTGMLQQSRKPRIGVDHERLSLPPGDVWLHDFIPHPKDDLKNFVASACFKERRTGYLKIYKLKNLSADFWIAVRDVNNWCKRTVGVNMRFIIGDSDPVWTNVQQPGGDPDSAEAKRLKQEEGIEFRRTPGGRHNSDMEVSIKRIRAVANMMLQYMRMSTKVLSYAIKYAEPILNCMSQPNSARPDLANGITPHEALLGAVPDTSSLQAPLFCFGQASRSGKPGDGTPQSITALYVGVPPQTGGWLMLSLPHLKEFVSSTVVFDARPEHRPQILEAHDIVIGNAGPMPVSNLQYHNMVRNLFEDSNLLQQPISERTIIVHSPLTRLPVTLVYSLDHNRDVLLSPIAPANTPSVPDDVDAVTPTGTTSTLPPPLVIPPPTGRKLSAIDRSALRNMPTDTSIEVIQSNPKQRGSAS